MKTYGAAIALSLLAACNAPETRQSAEAQTARPNLYACDGCDAILERNAAKLTAQSVMTPPGEPGDRLMIEGTIFEIDGVSRAEGVVLYAWQTNTAGLYANAADDQITDHAHGRLRGWVKTGADGRYRFDTIKPAPYPGDTLPAHIHLVVLESGRRPYYIDDVVFDGEFGVTPEYVGAAENRGGNGIVSLQRKSGAWYARRDVTLERHP